MKRRSSYPSPFETPKKKRKRTWRELGTQVAAGSSAATLGFIVGNVPTAVDAGLAAWEYTAPNLDINDPDPGDGIEDLYNAAFGSSSLPKKTMPGYGGRFRNSGKVAAVDKSKKKYQQKGYCQTTELYGTVVDPDCVYLLHSTYSAEMFAESIAQALVRKLLIKAGFEITSWHNVVQPLSWNSVINASSSQGWFIQLDTQDISGVTGKLDYVFEANLKFVDIANKTFAGADFSLKLFIERCLRSVAPGYANPRYLRLYMETGQATRPYSLVSALNLQDEYVQLSSHSILTVQNRTAPAGAVVGVGETATTEAVDAQPLFGKLYQFKSGVPRFVGDDVAANFEIERLNYKGMHLVRAGQLLKMKKPPVSSVFGNCRKANDISLNVGVVKNSYIVSQFKGGLLDFLAKNSSKAISGVAANTAVPVYSYVPGHSEMVALEERMNTGSSNQIQVGYQCAKTVGCFLVTKKKPCILEGFEDILYNNVSA